MNHPVEEAASRAASHINKVGLTVSWAGNGVSGFMSYLNGHQTDLQTLALILTITYTLWQFGRDMLRDYLKTKREKIAHSKLLERIKAMQTRPAQLTPEERYASSPTPLFDETYPPNQDHHEGKRQ